MRGYGRRSGVAGIGLLMLAAGAHAADLSRALPTKAPPPLAPAAYDWTGFYLGAHLGDAWGSSRFAGPAEVSGSLDLSQPYDAFKGDGSDFGGLQAGFNYMLPNRVVLGIEGDASFPSFPTLAGVSIGSGSMVSVPPVGPESYSETMLDFGTVR